MSKNLHITFRYKDELSHGEWRVQDMLDVVSARVYSGLRTWSRLRV